MLVFVFYDTLQEFVSKQIVRFYNNCNQNDLMQKPHAFFYNFDFLLPAFASIANILSTSILQNASFNSGIRV